MISPHSPDCETSDDFAEAMLGKPYLDRCCGVDAVDCWGLVVLYHRLVEGVNIHHSEEYSAGGDFVTCHDEEVSFWREVTNPRRGDVVVAYRGSRPAHVGLWWQRDTILHSREKTCVRFDRIATLERLSTKLRFLRYADNSHP